MSLNIKIKKERQKKGNVKEKNIYWKVLFLLPGSNILISFHKVTVLAICCMARKLTIMLKVLLSEKITIFTSSTYQSTSFFYIRLHGFHPLVHLFDKYLLNTDVQESRQPIFCTREKAGKEIHNVPSSSTLFPTRGWTDDKHNQPGQLLERPGHGVWKQVSGCGSESEKSGWKGWRRSCIVHFTDAKTEVWRSEGMCPSPHCWYRAWIQDQALKSRL